MKTRSIAPIRTAKIGYLAVSAVLCILGIFLIVRPTVSASMVGIVCGVLLIVFGIVKLVGFFSKDLYRLAFQYDLAFGILLILIGIIMLMRPNRLMNFICITLGLAILTDALFKAQMVLDAKQFGLRSWWLILLFSAVAAVFGVLLVLRPGEGSVFLMVYLGLTLLSEGILNISTMLTAVKIIRHQQPDVIEVTHFEERED